MSKEERSLVRHFTDQSGRALVAVTVTKRDREVILTAEDWAHVQAQGVSAKLFANSNGAKSTYVRCKPHGRNTTSVAKLILHPTPHQHIHHLDGDGYNQRPENLILGDGYHCTKGCPCRRTGTRLLDSE